MESYSSFQNWWESFQRGLALDTIFRLVVDLDGGENQDQVDPASPTSTGSRTVSRTATTTMTRVNVLVPAFDAVARKLGVRGAVILLTTAVTTNPQTWQGLATALHQAGLVATTVTLAIAAAWSTRALQLLTAAVRQSGVISYAEVAWIAFSYRAELAVASLLHLYLLLYVTQQLAALHTCVRAVLEWSAITLGRHELHAAGVVLFLVVAAAAPTVTIRDVFPLRIVATLSMGCLTIMIMALYAVVLWQNVPGHDDENENDASSTNEEEDNTTLWQALATLAKSVLLAYAPCFVLMLPVHAALHQPTNTRVVQVIRHSVWISFTLLWAVALALYLVKNDSNHWMLGLWNPNIYASTAMRSLVTLVQVMEALAILLATVVLMQPCRSNVLECIQRHYANSSISGEDGCCCDDPRNHFFPNCDKLHENCPEECLKDDAETAQETVPSFTSQSTTPRVRNNNAFTPVVSSAPAAHTTEYYGTTYPPPPLQVRVTRSSTTASELTPLVPSSGGSGSSVSSSSNNKRSSISSGSGGTGPIDHQSVPSLSSSDDNNYNSRNSRPPKRIVHIRQKPKGSNNGNDDDNKNNGSPEHSQTVQIDEEAIFLQAENDNPPSTRPPCNIDSNRYIRGYSAALIWLLCYLVAILGLNNNANNYNDSSSSSSDKGESWFVRIVSLTEVVASVLISYVLPVACFLKLNPRANRR